MSGYLDEDEGYQPVKKTAPAISIRTAMAIALVSGILLIAVWYLGAQYHATPPGQ